LKRKATRVASSFVACCAMSISRHAPFNATGRSSHLARVSDHRRQIVLTLAAIRRQAVRSDLFAGFSLPPCRFPDPPPHPSGSLDGKAARASRRLIRPASTNRFHHFSSPTFFLRVIASRLTKVDRELPLISRSCHHRAKRRSALPGLRVLNGSLRLLVRRADSTPRF